MERNTMKRKDDYSNGRRNPSKGWASLLRPFQVLRRRPFEELQ